MDADLLIVIGVVICAAAIHPSTEDALHRLNVALRFWRSGHYSWRAAWRHAQDR